MTRPDEVQAWRLGLAVIDAQFARAQSELGDAVPCARGCSACCESAAFFEIHAADAELLREGLARAAPEIRRGVVARARALVADARRAAAELGPEEPLLRGWEPAEGLATLPARVRERLAGRLAGACPVLEAGECALHEHRPAICRLQGLRWRDPGTGAELPDFCALDERQGALPAREIDLAAFDALREDVRCRLAGSSGGGQGSRTFVAAVLAAPEAHAR